MKNPRVNSKQALLACLISGVVAILLLILIPWQAERREKPQAIITRFQTFLQEHEKHIRDEITQISDRFAAGTTTSLTISRLDSIPAPTDNEMTVLIYQGDSLIYWTDNTVPFSPVFLQRPISYPAVIKLANGWYEFSVESKGLFSVVILCLIKQEYPFQNQYLKNDYVGSIRIPEEVKISLLPGNYNAYSSRGEFLCSLDIPSGLPPEQGRSWLVFLLAVAYLSLITCVYRLAGMFQGIFTDRRRLFFFMLFVIIVLRGLQFMLQWPESLYNSDLFGPTLYSSSRLFPSLGDVVINSLLVLAAAFIFYHTWPARRSAESQSATWPWIQPVISFLISLVTLIAVMAGVHSLVIHSTLPMNLENISRLTWDSLPAFVSIGFLALAWILLTLRMTVPGQDAEMTPGVIPKRKFPFPWFFLAMALFAAVATVILNRANTKREKEQRELIAMRLAARQNPVTELLLQQSVEAIQQDTAVRRILRRNEGSETTRQMIDDSAVSYLISHYFTGYWNNFNIQVTVCRPSKTLRIQPSGIVIGCSGYFEELIASFGQKSREKIYFLDYGYGNENYIARLPVEGDGSVVYVEVSSRGTYRDLGYPELLMDRKSYDIPDLTDYSYAFYQDNQLIHRVGEYTYGFELSGYVDTATGTVLPSPDRMDHLLYRINDTDSLLISKSLPSWLNRVSPFSYLLILLVFLFALGYGILHLGELKNLTTLSLRNRLQMTMLGMIITVFIITGGLMLVYVTWLNSQKNEEGLLERTLSILIEVEHKFDHLDDLQDAGSDELETILIKFSNVFFSDINLYDPQGVLLASSRKRIFQEGLISDRINSHAFVRLHAKHTSMFVQTEQIGSLQYLSAYVPFYNTRNTLLGYVNLPYFSREDDLKREISTFLVAFVNTYVLFLLIGALVTYLVGNYITSPLKLLALRIGRLRIGKTNDKLIWRREDEIGKLVAEYNRMLDELTVSAEKLAVSERESAWREMAQQVAHEIKNPLTPMKLGVQYLQKAWDDKAEDWDNRLKRFSDALIAQIESLSAIASEFSYFARMPEPENEQINLDDLVRNALAMYKDVSSILITFHPSDTVKWVFADKRQLLRVFSNLLNNAMEAIEAQPGTEGKILVETETTESEHWIRVSDNGKGIQAEEADKIFQPNFTTRSGGAGLGLAIVKGIIHSIGGSIRFTSDPGKMTTFIIRIPMAHPVESGENREIDT